MKNYYSLILMLTLISFSFTTIKDPPWPKPSDDIDPPGLPIDGGVALLLLIGTGYGVFKLKKK